MSLSDRQRQEFYDALVNAFLPDEFDRLLHIKLNKRRTDIVGEKGFPAIVSEVLLAADKDEWTRQLIQAAVETSPDNKYLREFVTRNPEFAPSGESATPPAVTFACILCISPPPSAEKKRGLWNLLGLTKLPPPQQRPLQWLLEAIRVEVAKQQTGTSGSILCEPRWEGVLVVTDGDPAPLLKLALHVAKTVNSPDGRRLRMGLHFIPIAKPTGGGIAKLPYEGEFVSRRLTMLGHSGHILLTGEAREFIEGNPDLAAIFEEEAAPEHQPETVFRPAGRVELRLNAPTEIYSLVGSSFGNGERPEQKLPEPVSAKIPRTLLESRKDKIKATFWEGIPYAEVKFEFKNKKEINIGVDCDKPRLGDCTFELDFERLNDKRVQAFGLKLVDRAGYKRVSLLLRCSDRYGELLMESVPQPIRLRRNYLTWLWDRFRFSPWYVKAALAPALAITIYLAGPWPKPWDRIDSPPQEPGVMSDLPPLHFKSTEDTGAYWDIPASEIVLGEGSGGGDNKALDLSGPRVIFLKRDRDNEKSFYDFNLTFLIKLKPGTKMAGWVFRAQPGDRRGYWFALERKANNELVLHGTYVDDETDLTSFDSLSSAAFDRLGLPREIPVGTYQDGDFIDVIVTVDGYKFTHQVRRKSGTKGRPDSEFQKIAPDFVVDGEPRFRYGNVGLWAHKNGGMLIDYWVINNSHKSDSPAPSVP